MCVLRCSWRVANGFPLLAEEVAGEEEELRAQSGQTIKANADPELAVPQQHQSSTRLSTTIYMETVRFLLQNSALQVSGKTAPHTTH